MLLFTKILLVILHLITLPTNAMTLFLLFLYKQCVILVAKLSREFIGPIPSSSCVFLSDKIWTRPHSSIVCVLELDKKISEDLATAQFQKAYDLRDKNGARCYKELGYYPVIYFGYGFWEEQKNFKISDRVHLLKEKSKQDEEPLTSIIEKMLRQPYKEGDPLWDIFLLYKPSDTSSKTMVFIRLHHLLADGMSFVKLFYATFGFNSLPPSFTKPSNSMQRWNQLASSVPAKISAFFGLITVGFIDYLDQVLISQDKNPINFDPEGKLKLSGEWVCSISKKLEVAELKRASRAYDCSILHLILCGISRGLEQYFKKYHQDEPPPQEAHFVFPVPIPGHPDLRLVNHWALARIPSKLNNSEAKLSEKLLELKEEVKRAGMSSLPLISAFMFRYVVGLLPLALANGITRAKATSTVVLSNVVGPQIKGIVEDAAITDMFFWMPIVQQSMALSAGVFSYNGGIRICLSADLGCIPDRSRLDDLSGMIYDELIESCRLGKT